MIIRFDGKTLTAIKDSKKIISISASNLVRNEINRWRKNNQLVKTAPVQGEKKYYQPREFPTGIWKITEVIYTDVENFAPVIIKTDATRAVFLWEVENGEYKNITEEIQIDGSYWIHHNRNSSTSWGCINPLKPADILELAHLIEPELDAGNAVFLEVI